MSALRTLIQTIFLQLEVPQLPVNTEPRGLDAATAAVLAGVNLMYMTWNDS